MKKSALISLTKEVLQENNSLIKTTFAEEKILIPRRTPEERRRNFIKATQQKIQQYIKNGSKGDLDLSNTPITSLPDNLKQVGGYLDLSFTSITSLPDNLKHVGGYLDLYNTKITKLPDNLTVGGSLYLYNTPITKLPDNLTVGGWLDLNNTPITSLPDNLTVGGWLDLNNTPITTIPTSAKIKGNIYGLKNESIMKKSELKEVIKEYILEIWDSADEFTKTASWLLGIDDDWTVKNIKDHLLWLIRNPDEIADEYDRSVFKLGNVTKIMEIVKRLRGQRGKI
jgi:hypothetical protein